MAKKEASEITERLIAYWQIDRHFDANMADLARYARVSRDTVYRWLNRKAQPRAQKDRLIQEWLNQKTSQFCEPSNHQEVVQASIRLLQGSFEESSN
ncbi:MAG: hypothetical protein ISS43_03180 [Candidatus Omnitrophica bacterium]|nr:hypothetical protein [Candidatus Omnitrophota bacterium]